MATTYLPFQSSATQVFSFNAALTNAAGTVAVYTITVPWNIFGQRYYVTCVSQTGQHIFTLPLISSPDDYDISMSAGYFTTTLVFRASTLNFEITDAS
jgi:hypothetical protein